MPNDKRSRLTKITTRAGDQGKTKLATGTTVHKHHPVVRAMGSVDELNSQIGLLAQQLSGEHLKQTKQIQQNLFDMGAVFAMQGQYQAPNLEFIETATTDMNEHLPPLTEFVIPGGGRAASQGHICRSVCRRAETDVWAHLTEFVETPDELLRCAQYLNRLSDYFFVLARTLSRSSNSQTADNQATEEQWSGPGPSG